MLWLFVCAFFLPAFAQNENGVLKEDALICPSPEVISAGDKFFSCFDVTVKNTLRHENKNCSTRFVEGIFEYVNIANETCYLDMVNRERDSLEFYKLMQFSLKNDLFRDFIANGGKECINAVKKDIAQCVTSNIGHTNGVNDKYYTLWKESALWYDKQKCLTGDNIKRCVLKAMRNEGWYRCHYAGDVTLYVSWLFDFLLERCTRLIPGWDDQLRLFRERCCCCVGTVVSQPARSRPGRPCRRALPGINAHNCKCNCQHYIHITLYYAVVIIICLFT